MRTPLLTLLAATLLQPLARADKFWFEAPDSKDRVEGSSPAMIEGVLLAERGDVYVIRVVGGEIEVPKRLVVRVESDSLTVAAVEALEHKAAQRGATRAPAADVPVPAARVPAPEPHDVDRLLDAAAAEAAPPAMGCDTWFDPALGVARPGCGYDHYETMFALKLAYEQTGEHRYIKMLRQLRRLF